MKNYSKKEIRDAALASITGMMARLDMNAVSSKAKKLAKELSSILSRAIAEEHRRQLKKQRRRLEEDKKKASRKKKTSGKSVPPNV